MATVTFIHYERQSAGALLRVSDYVSQEGKTLTEDGLQMVSGQNCTPQLAVQEFRATRDAYRKDSPVWFYHYVQSFHPDEQITGPEAHQVAKEFAEKAWPDSEVLIATHIDADHVHSHFLVNAVCYLTGKMLRQDPNTLKRLRKLSDEICERHYLSVLPPQQKTASTGMTGREYRSAAKGQSWKFRLMNTVDQCMRYARTRDEFIALMRSEGYDVRWQDSRKNITYTTPDGLKCRDDRLHQPKYLREAMEYEFRIRTELVTGRTETEKPAHSPGGPAEDAAGPGGVAPAASPAGRHRHAAVGAHTPPAGDQPTAHPVAAGGSTQTDHGGTPGDQETAKTGWEAERAALFSAANRAPGDPAVPPHSAADPDVWGRLAGDVVQLGRALEHTQSAPPIKDTTTPPAHSDRKALAKERQKKIAQGHKADDHEDQPSWQQTM